MPVRPAIIRRQRIVLAKGDDVELPNAESLRIPDNRAQVEKDFPMPLPRDPILRAWWSPAGNIPFLARFQMIDVRRDRRDLRRLSVRARNANAVAGKTAIMVYASTVDAIAESGDVANVALNQLNAFQLHTNEGAAQTVQFDLPQASASRVGLEYFFESTEQQQIVVEVAAASGDLIRGPRILGHGQTLATQGHGARTGHQAVLNCNEPNRWRITTLSDPNNDWSLT